jgi:hypothetical protein
MKIVKSVGHQGPKPVRLRDVEVGSAFHFAEDTFEEAMSGKDESTFYMKMAVAGADARINVVSLDGKSFIQRDGDRQVFVVKAEVNISTQ